MSIADLAEFKERLLTGQQVPFNINSAGIVAARPNDSWISSWTPLGQGAAPTTAVVPTKDTPGALPIANAAGTLSIIGGRIGAINPGIWMVCDRLSHQGGLVGNVATTQTTNLPTAALTRYTSGARVFAGLSIYTAIGGTGTTFTISYTNQAGTTGRTSTAHAIGGANQNAQRRFIWIPLQSPDTGVRAVASVTLAATTGTAGNMGVVLFKPLCLMIIETILGVSHGSFVRGPWPGGIPEVEDDACLFLVPIPMAVGNNDMTAAGSLIVAEH